MHTWMTHKLSIQSKLSSPRNGNKDIERYKSRKFYASLPGKEKLMMKCMWCCDVLYIEKGQKINKSWTFE